MEVIELRSAHVSNAEVFAFLSEQQADRAANPPVFNPGAPPDVNLKDLHIIEDEVVRFLQATPCVDQDAASIKKFMDVMRAYDLTKGEKLTLLNLRPTLKPELTPMVEDIDSRMTEEQQDALVNLIAETLPYPSAPVKEEEEEGEEGAGDAMEE